MKYNSVIFCLSTLCAVLSTGYGDSNSAGNGNSNPVVDLAVGETLTIPLSDSVDLEMVKTPQGPLFGKYEVTQVQWETLLGNNPSSSDSKMPNLPVENVSWYDCQLFLSILNNDIPTVKELGLTFRLPTQEEWEQACMAGSNGKYCRLADGTEITEASLGQVAWFDDNSNYKFHPGGQKLPNAWGLYDMLGNVWEMTETVFFNRSASGGSIWESSDRGFFSSGSRSMPMYNLKQRESVGFRVCASDGLDYAEVEKRATHERAKASKTVAKSDKADAKMNIREDGKVQLWKGGPYWADKNIGAEKPEDHGLYFWWGDTVGYRREGNSWIASDGSSSNFSFSSVNMKPYDKDVSTLQSDGWVVSKDGTYVLAPEHDAAHVHLGGSWRVPTKQELEDLNKKCDWVWTTRNGVNGFIVSGKGDYESASIFLPAAGYVNGTLLNNAGSDGSYWSSVPDSSYSKNSWHLYFGSGYHRTDSYGRYYGFPVRPVQGSAE